MNNLDFIIKQSKASIEKEDLAVLFSLLRETPPIKILEIGTWKGASAKVWYEAFYPIDILVTIEKDAYAYKYQPHSLSYVHGDSHSPETHELIKALFGKRKIDFLFIDGDHSYEGVKKDWELYEPLVEIGGAIVLHDAYYHVDGTEEVDIFRQELGNQGHTFIKIQESKNSTGMAVLFKK